MVGHALGQVSARARVVGGIAYEPKSAEQLRGEWNGRLDKSMLIRTARAIAADLVASLRAVLAALYGRGRSPKAATARFSPRPLRPRLAPPAPAPSPASLSPLPVRPLAPGPPRYPLLPAYGPWPHHGGR